MPSEPAFDPRSRKVVALRGGVANPPGPPHDGGMEARISALEATLQGVDKRLSLVEADLRALASKVDRNFVITWAGIIGLGVMIAKGFGWLG